MCSIKARLLQKESYEIMKETFSCVSYKTYQLHICGDMKVIAILIGLHEGYTIFCFSFVNGIVILKVFTTGRRTGLYVHHIHLEQRT
jgi:hypothetical protein